MLQEEVDNYYNEWKSFAVYSEGGDYMNLFAESYAMITDCGSFLTEYFITEKPIIHMISEHFKGNPLINEIDTTYYQAHNKDELLKHLNDVIINKNDYKKEQRNLVLNKFSLKDNSAANRIINEIYSDIFKTETL